MTLRVRTVDAFTDQPFTGNPAAVIRMDDWAELPPQSWYRSIAAELNLSETAFLERYENADADFRLRWFTPAMEVDLCGHATLAMSHCLFADGVRGPVRYATRSGVLTVRQADDGGITMDLPAQPPQQIAVPDWLPAAIGHQPEYLGEASSGYLLAVLDGDRGVRELTPDLAAISRHVGHGLIVSAAAAESSGLDFVSRFFAPAMGVPEDPVTGSAHTVLVPYWAGRLGRAELAAAQVSPRGGCLTLRLAGDRVLITGRAVTVLDGTLLSVPSGRLTP